MLLSIATIFAQQQKGYNNKADNLVFICYSQSTDYYHKSINCASLDKCNNLQKVTQDDAVNKYHRRPCKKCTQPQSSQAH